MASYIGKVRIGNDNYPIANTIYATCSTGATTALKEIVYPDFDTLTDKVSIPIKFTYGNTVQNGVTLKFNNSDDAYAVEGNCLCSADEVITFTYEDNEVESARRWRSHKTEVIISEDSTSGILTIDGQTAGSKLSERIDNLNNSISGLTGAMHFRGSIDVDPTKQAIPGEATYAAGDVVLGPNNKEYVYTGINWLELGDEGSYVLKSSLGQASIMGTLNWSPGTMPTLNPEAVTVSGVTMATAGENPITVSNTVTVPDTITGGTATTASVSQGVLTISIGSNVEVARQVTLTPSVVTVQSATGWTNGSAPSLSDNNNFQVVKFNTTP